MLSTWNFQLECAGYLMRTLNIFLILLHASCFLNCGWTCKALKRKLGFFLRLLWIIKTVYVRESELRKKTQGGLDTECFVFFIYTHFSILYNSSLCFRLVLRPGISRQYSFYTPVLHPQYNLDRERIKWIELLSFITPQERYREGYIFGES